MTMDCGAVKRCLGAWLDRELGHSEAEEVRAHLQDCSSCLDEKARLERLGASLKSALEARASGIGFEPFWDGVRQRILAKRPWHAELLDWARFAVRAQRLAWAIPVAIVFLLGVLSLEDFFPGWRWGSGKGNAAAVDSIDGHGLNVALLRESKTKTTVIWLFENQEEEDDEPPEEPAPTDPTF